MYMLRLKNRKKLHMLIMAFVPISRLILINKSFQEKYWIPTNNVVNLDAPFLLLNFDHPINSKILDFGCGGTPVSAGLTMFGYTISGIDFQETNFQHKNFIFIKNDFFKADFKKNSFDCVLAISVLEHVGMGHYGDQPVENADLKSIEKIKEILKPGGFLYISVPGGRKKIYQKDGISYIRIFDPTTIEKLLTGFTIERELFFEKINQQWIETSKKNIESLEYDGEDIGAILIKAKKDF